MTIALALAPACVTPRELGEPFSYAPPAAAAKPTIYLYTGQGHCSLRLHTPAGVFSLPIQSGGYFPLVTDPGGIDIDVQRTAERGSQGMGHIVDFVYKNHLQAAAGEAHFVRCDIYVVAGERVWDVVFVEKAAALRELAGRREISAEELEAW